MAEPRADMITGKAGEIEFRHVSKRYPGRSQAAVNDLSLAIPAGEICVLVGPSGAGKTTAMKMVNRLIDVTEGEILIDGRDVTRMDETELRRGIGYVIQHVGLFPHMNVGANVATVPRLLGWDRARVQARVEELLELVGLDPQDDARRYPAQLSGGQRQRVGLARALAADPPVMLMDEPFGALDPITRDRLQNEFLRLHRQIRKTVIFVTHDIDEAIKMGDKIAILREGGVLAQYASPAEILAQPADDFVAQFVGADRALKRLSLSRVRDVELLDSAPDPADAPVLTPDTSLRDALSQILAEDGRPLPVEDHGSALGYVSVELITRALAGSSEGAAA
ncbi:MAG TPA: ABC transporter ATP-binding protein [Thermoleophilaceae bacterium]